MFSSNLLFKTLLVKASFIFSLLLISLTRVLAQNFHENVRVDSLLVNQHYHVNSGACGQTTDIHILLDSTLFNYVDGLSFNIIIDSVKYSGPPCCVTAGDTIVLNAESPDYSRISGSVSDFWFRVLLQGTPSTAQQRYPCELEVIQCTCYCLDMEIKSSWSSDCYVEGAESIGKTIDNNVLQLYPNPSSTGFRVLGLTGVGQISLYNALGEQVVSSEVVAGSIFNTSNLAGGIYTAVVTGINQTQVIKEVVVAK